jgi:uncharacterized membrane protein
MILLALTLAVAWFIWHTAQTMMPAEVALHFDHAGKADGYGPRSEYVAWFISIAVGLPLLIGVLPGVLITRFGGKGINLPFDRDYWLAPERRDATLGFFRALFCWIAGAMAVFVGYSHWLTIRANQLPSPALPATGMGAGMAVFLLMGPVLLVVIALRFTKRS